MSFFAKAPCVGHGRLDSKQTYVCGVFVLLFVLEMVDDARLRLGQTGRMRGMKKLRLSIMQTLVRVSSPSMCSGGLHVFICLGSSAIARRPI